MRNSVLDWVCNILQHPVRQFEDHMTASIFRNFFVVSSYWSLIRTWFSMLQQSLVATALRELLNYLLVMWSRLVWQTFIIVLKYWLNNLCSALLNFQLWRLREIVVCNWNMTNSSVFRWQKLNMVRDLQFLEHHCKWHTLYALLILMQIQSWKICWLTTS